MSARILTAALALSVLGGTPATATQAPKAPADPFGPCLLSAPTTYELIATGVCKCKDGQCLVLDCRAEVGANIEVTKGDLKAKLEAKARLNNGEVTFTLKKK